MRILVIILIVQLVFKPIIPLVEYVVRYDYIKNELCENKDQPVLKCDGKCHLKKQLSKESETKNPVSETKKQTPSSVELLFCQAKIILHFNQDFTTYTEEIFQPYAEKLTVGFDATLDIPPNHLV